MIHDMPPGFISLSHTLLNGNCPVIQVCITASRIHTFTLVHQINHDRELRDRLQAHLQEADERAQELEAQVWRLVEVGGGWWRPGKC